MLRDDGAKASAERLLARPDGERRLTNLRHLAECLHEAAAEHATPEALLRWLQRSSAASRAATTPRSCGWSPTATWCRS